MNDARQFCHPELVSGSNAFAKIIKLFRFIFFFSIFLGSFFVLANEASAATYYVDATLGKDTYNGITTTINDGASEGPWKTLTKVNAALNAASIHAGDSVLFKAGETFFGYLYVKVTGTVGNILTFDSYGSGNKPIIDATGNNSGIDLRGINYVTFNNLDVRNATFQGYFFLNGNDHITINNGSISSSAKAIHLYNNTISNLTISNLNASNNTYGIYGFAGVTVNTLSISNSHFDDNTSEGFFTDGTANGSNFTITDTTMSRNGIGSDKNGFLLQGTGSTVILTRVTSANNGGDGFGVHNTWIGVIFDYCTADTNGTDGIGSDGDGFSFHETSSGIIRYSISKNNLKTAIAHVNSSAVEMYYDLFYHATNGTLPLVLLQNTGNHKLYNNIIYSGSQTGDAVSVEGTVDMQNNIIDGFNRGLIKTGGTISNDHDIIYGVLTSNYVGISAGAYSIIQDPKFFNSSIYNFSLLPTSPAIDSGTDVSLTTDYAGNSIYGTPDIGAYEYQPPYTMGTDAVNTSTSVRMYGDEKFRNKTATTTETTADLSITIPDSDKTKWLDIAVSTWDNSGTYHKTWTENTTSTITNTLHTIGDLEPNKYYNVSVDSVLGNNITGDNCSNGLCLSNAEGKISFTYTGSYSEHTFDVEEGDNTAPIRSAGLPSGSQPAGTTQVTMSLTTDENATCKYSTSADTAYASMTDTFTTTGTQSHSTTISGLSNGNTYNYYVRCTDGSNANSNDYPISFSITNPTAHSSGNSAQSRINNLLSMGNYTQAQQLANQYNISIPVITTPPTAPLLNQGGERSVNAYNFGLSVLKKGSKGEAVKELQKFLNQDLKLNLKIDGILGSKTTMAIKQYQKAHNLKVDGVVGEKTKGRMGV
ncbi:MAG: peptidoglycan-binding protein [Candidatus Pacebacteria bacterium]|nr:peptidoglycan-binding protein [Candidatus Paceibacterota bacterium]